jgi:iron complex outermembrane receptor protein
MSIWLFVSSRFPAAVLALGLALGSSSVCASLAAQTTTVTPPRVIEQPSASWPGSPLPNDLFIPVIITVNADGRVGDVQVLEAHGEVYDRAAVENARRWRLEPARRNGAPVTARVRARVRFAAAPPNSPSTAAPPSSPPTAALPAPAAAPVTPPASAAAQPLPPPAPEATAVIVRGRQPPPPRGGSDFHVTVGELARVPRKNAAQLLELAPGVYLTNEGGEGHAERIYLRGFDAREGQDLEVSVAGVPVNESGNLHGNGFADLHFIIPELVESLRVLEGPFDPRQGNYAVAGSVDYEPGLTQRGLTAKYTRGSFGSERLLLTFGPPGGSSHTFGGAEIHRSDGFGQNRDSRRATAMAQYEGELGPGTTFRLAGSGYATEYHSAGFLRADDVAAGRVGFFDTYDARQGGGGTRFQVSADITSSAGGFSLYQQLFAVRRGMRLRENLTGFLLDTQGAVQSPHPQRGDLFDLDMAETTFGGRGFARTEGQAFGQRQELEFGYFARGDSVEGTRQRIESATGVPYRTDTALDSKLADLGLYADVALRPLPLLVLRGGVRADLFAFDVHDACAVKDVSRPAPNDPPGDASCLDQQRFGAHREPDQRSSTASSTLMPRATATLGPIRHFSFSLAYGQGVRSIDPSYVSEGAETPFASVEAEEASVMYARSFPEFSLVARSVFFRTHVDRDLVFSETEGRSVLGGGTTRTGWTGAVRFTHHFVDQNATLTLVRSAFDEDGLLVPYVPDVVLRSDTVFSAALPFEVDAEAPRAALALGASYIGRRALPYGQRSETIFTLDGSASASFRGYELELEVTNLLDARYRQAEYDYVSDFGSGDPPTLVPARHFAAGAPRAFFVSLSANFGGS